MKVKNVMSRDPATCSPETSLSDAARVMWERDVGFVPVVDALTRRLVGVVTDRDACMAAYTQGRRLGEILVRTAMSRRTWTCQEEDDVTKAHALMAEHKVRRLPVTNAVGEVLGVVSLNDLARDAQVHAVAKPQVASTLGAICEPRLLRPASEIESRLRAHEAVEHPALRGHSPRLDPARS